MRHDLDDYLHITDAPELPNGMATVFKVSLDPNHHELALATPDRYGFFRTLNTDRKHLRRDYCELIEVLDL